MSPAWWCASPTRSFLVLFLFACFFELLLTQLQQQADRLHDTEASLHSLLNKSSHFRQYVNKLILSAASFFRIIYCDCFIYSLRILIFLVLHSVSVSTILTAHTCAYSSYSNLTLIAHSDPGSLPFRLYYLLESLWSLHSLLKIIKFHFDLHGVRRLQ